jgi:NAD(P)-dependent dehydrogenase (short-subunit alcohol dehydrogenase family)
MQNRPAFSRRSFLWAFGLVCGGVPFGRYSNAWAEPTEDEKRRLALWTVGDIPNQAGRSVVITGGNSGIGFEDSLALARAGADVVIASRNKEKGDEAIANIRQTVPGAKIRFEQLDLDSLASIADFSSRLRSKQKSLDLLINNAGVLAIPKREVTEDGFETQFATNYLGHFALTARLLPMLREARQARVVTISAVTAGLGVIDFDNLQGEKEYVPAKAYLQTKLADLMFALELQRRSEAGRWGIASLAAHPGVSNTDLFVNGPGADSAAARSVREHPENYQPAAQGALPTLYAATSPDAKGGMYFGPNAADERSGTTGYAKVPPVALDAAVAKRLWETSERLSGVRFPNA